MLSSNSSYIVEPVPGSPDQHFIYRLGDLRLHRGACGHQDGTVTAEGWLRDFTAGVKSPHLRVRRALTGSPCDAPDFPLAPSLRILLLCRSTAWKGKWARISERCSKLVAKQWFWQGTQ